MDTQNTTHDVVMKRVRRVHMLRRAAQPMYVRIYALAALLLGTAALVSVGSVLENMPATLSFAAYWKFFSVAVMNTEFVVQLLLGGAAILALFMVRDIIKTARTRPHTLPVQQA